MYGVILITHTKLDLIWTLTLTLVSRLSGSMLKTRKRRRTTRPAGTWMRQAREPPPPSPEDPQALRVEAIILPAGCTRVPPHAAPPRPGLSSSSSPGAGVVLP